MKENFSDTTDFRQDGATAAHDVGMDVRLHDSIGDFGAAAVEVYERDPVAATVELTILRRSRTASDPPPVLLTVTDGGALVGAAMQTPPRPLLCTGLPESAIHDVVAELAQLRLSLPGVVGTHRIAISFAEAWCKRTGALSTISLKQRLYRLHALHPPTLADGEPRPVTSDEIGMLVDWFDRFRAEAFGDVPEPAATAESLRTAKETGDGFLFWVVEGDPVSMAAVRPPTAGVSAIGPVYTPPAKRGNGFGSAVTAAAAAWAHDAGAAEVVLFTDLANPVSNSIYQRIGFRPVMDFARIDFTGPV